METRNITLDTVLEKAIALETAKKQMQCMTAGGSVNAIRKREEKARDKSGKTCFGCGKKGYFAWDPCCPAKGRNCAKCSNMDILLLIAKEIILRWKVVKTANREKLAMAKKELEDRQTTWEVTPWSMSVARKGIQHLHLL